MTMAVFSLKNPHYTVGRHVEAGYDGHSLAANTLNMGNSCVYGSRTGRPGTAGTALRTISGI